MKLIKQIYITLAIIIGICAIIFSLDIIICYIEGVKISPNTNASTEFPQMIIACFLITINALMFSLIYHFRKK